MKRWWLILFLCSFVSASVDVHNYTMEDDYFLYENVKGEINLTIEDEVYNERIFSGNQEIELDVFLRNNGVIFDCSPPDCSMGYEFSSGVVDKTFDVALLQNKYVGFVLSGEDIVLDSLNFKVVSNFERGSLQPLVIEFFEKEKWGFDIFSDEFLPKDWGCFDPISKRTGPLIGNSFYCEMINIRDSGVLRVGADVVGNEIVELDMIVYPESGMGASWECSFNPNEEDGCEVSPDIGEIFSAGNYQVCIGAGSLTNYRIYEEVNGKSCGFVYSAGPEYSSKDYGIFARVVKYESADSPWSIDFNNKIVDAGNTLIRERYGGDCSEGCVLPLKISGVSQNMRIYDINLVYTRNAEWDSSNLVYDLMETSAKVDFSGVLNLELLGFVVSKAGEFVINLGDKVLAKRNMKILPAPIILSVLPLDSPAGVPVKFYVMVDFDGNKSLSYKWYFGDGENAITDVPYVFHSYNDLQNYTLSLEVSAGGNLSSEKEFIVNVISPEDAVNSSLILKKNAINSIQSIIVSYPSWYKDELANILDIDRFEGDLERLTRQQNNSFDVEDFIEIAVELYGLNIPVIIGANSFDIPFLMTELSDIKVEPVVLIAGGESGKNEDYVNPILNWQNENIDVSFVKEEFFVSYWNGKSADVLSVYSFNVVSKSDRESYFVINKPFSELYFKESVGARKAGDATVIVLGAGEEVSFEFYYEDIESVGIFVSPKLSALVIEADIDTSCNYNLVCEEEMGENPDNCRTDCKPTGKAMMFLILSILFLLVVYTGLQIWYKRHYEGYLFKDEAQMYNLLMYVTNARARGMTDLRIRAELRVKGWSKERVDYIIKKSRGDKVGMIEIVPIERIAAYFRNRKARLAQSKKVVTGNQQRSRHAQRVP